MKGGQPENRFLRTGLMLRIFQASNWSDAVMLIRDMPIWSSDYVFALSAASGRMGRLTVGLQTESALGSTRQTR